MNDMTITFTVGQLFAVVGAASLFALTIYIVIVLVRMAQFFKRATALIEETQEALGDIRETTASVIDSLNDGFSKLATVFKLSKWLKRKK